MSAEKNDVKHAVPIPPFVRKEAMIELRIDRPVPELIAAEDPSTLRAIDEGIAQLDRGQGIPLEELREELTRRCSK
jgi:hypothetical protein